MKPWSEIQAALIAVSGELDKICGLWRKRTDEDGTLSRKALCWLACCWRGCSCVFALNPALDVSQYAHTSWKIREGFTKGSIRSIAQTPDGYLWLGTEFGLLRFDGVRTVPWQPPPDQHLPSSEIIHLLAARDGTLWIGTSKGLASWKDGKLIQYPELARQRIFKLLEDREGTIWVGHARVSPLPEGSARFRMAPSVAMARTVLLITECLACMRTAMAISGRE